MRVFLSAQVRTRPGRGLIASEPEPGGLRCRHLLRRGAGNQDLLRLTGTRWTNGPQRHPVWVKLWVSPLQVALELNSDSAVS